MRHIEPLETRRLLAAFTASSVAELVNDINAANVAGGANSITLMAGSAFSLAMANNEVDGPTGLPVIAAGDDLTINGNGDVIQRSTKRGTPAVRLCDVADGGALTLNSLTLSGGLIAGSGSGGGIFNAGTLNLNGVTLQSCIVRLLASALTSSPAAGGGICSYFGVLSITNSIIRDNQALGLNGSVSDSGFGSSPGGPAEGGGVYVFEGTAAVTNTTFYSNLARGGDGVSGGNQQPATQGGDGLGGAIYASGAALTLRGTSITGNAATGGTGGTTSKKAVVQSANGAGRGGGLYVAPASVVSLDSFTQANTKNNTASTSDNDIFGSFSIL
jgi:hypothetical protein